MQITAAIIVAIVCVDQACKAWAWRHAAEVHIDSGGGVLLPGTASWFRNTTVGVVVDIGDVFLLTAAILTVPKRCKSRAVLVSASLVLGGWTSDLSDRLALHRWTAPGSSRGVVDFLIVAGRSWNVADFVIIIGVLCLSTSLLVARLRTSAKTSVANPSQASPAELIRLTRRVDR